MKLFSKKKYIFPKEFSWIDIAVAFGRSKSWAEKFLARLYDADIVFKIGEGKYRFKGEEK